MNKPQPLAPITLPEVHLPNAPLERVIAQVRFPAILAIRNPDKVAGFQEMVRGRYPALNEERVQTIDLTNVDSPSFREGVIWRFTDGSNSFAWRVSLGVDFLALETSDYQSRGDFIDRIEEVLDALETCFAPREVRRLGLRYVDRLTDDALARIEDLIMPEVLGILSTTGELSKAISRSVHHKMTEAQFSGPEETRIQGRWGLLSENATYDPNAVEPLDKPSWILDLDMFSTEPQDFECEALLTDTRSFADCLYWLFRAMVKNEFLEFYGGQP